MLYSKALGMAEKIAALLVSGCNIVGRRSVRHQSLMGWLAVDTAINGDDVAHALDPIPREILLFGSLARGEAEVGDIDMMLLDGGFYSSIVVACNNAPKVGARRPNMYAGLSRNLQRMFEGFFEFDPQASGVAELLDGVKTDLHVLPVSILINSCKMREMAAKHHDPDFFPNAFSCLLRYDPQIGGFGSISIEALREKYEPATVC